MSTTILLHRALLPALFGALLANPVFGQAGAGAGVGAGAGAGGGAGAGAGAGGGSGAGSVEILPDPKPDPDTTRPDASVVHRRLVVAYAARGVLRPASHTLTIHDDGGAEVIVRDGATIRATMSGRLEAEEVAGLDEALEAFFAAPPRLTPMVAKDGVDRILAIERDAVVTKRSANRDDDATRAVIDWLDALTAMVKGGLLDDADKRLEAKFARPARGAHAASITTILRRRPLAFQSELDASGRRFVTRSFMLGPPEAAELAGIAETVEANDAADEVEDPIETILPMPGRPVIGSVALRPSPAVLRLWALSRHDFDLLREARPGLPALAVTVGLLLR